MKPYIETKIIDAEPMTCGDYNIYRGQIIPSTEDPAAPGYLVRYPDGYERWFSESAFEEAYRPKRGMTFGMAVEAMKKGYRVTRRGWNGVGMSVVMQKGYPDGIPCNKQTAEAWGMKEGELFKCRPYLQMRCADGTFQMWLASQSDILEEDWEVVDNG